MDALQAYTSDFSGAESDGSGEEQPKSVAAEAAEDVETIAEQRLFQLGGSEVGVLSFLMSCPPLTKLKICRNSIVAADLEEAWWEDGGTEYHYLTRSLPLLHRGTIDDQIKAGAIDANTICWEESTFTSCAHERFSHADLAELLVLIFGAAVFICQEQPGVWMIQSAADFVDLPTPSICCLSRIQDEAQQYLSLSETVSAALSVKLCLADDADFQWDYPQVSECGGNSEDEHTTVQVPFRSGHGKLEGYFDGNGQQLGAWDTYTAFWSEAKPPKSLWAGCQVSTPGAKNGAVLVRILSGKKKGGSRGAQQACYVCLLYKIDCTSGSPWIYATMPNITKVLDYNVDPPAFLEVSAETMSKIEVELRSFHPASVSGAVQQAGSAIPVEFKSERKRKRSI